MRFAELVECSERVAATRSRREKIAALAACLVNLEPDEAEVGVAALAGRIRQGRIGVGPATVFGVEVPVAPQATLTLTEVDAAMTAIGDARGARAKKRVLGALLERATATEQTFLRRLLVGELRQGALEGVLMDAVAKAAEVPAPALRRAAMLRGDLAVVAVAALQEGAPALAQFRLRVLAPIDPMLAASAERAGEAIERLGEAMLDFKLDGARIQLHKAGSEVRVFTRRLKDVTAAVPEVVELARGWKANEAVVDGEVIALTPDGRPLPFQTTMRRFGRKLDVERVRAELPLTPFFFDCLHVGGDTLIDAPIEERAEALAELVGTDALVPRRVTASPEVAEAFLRQARAAGHEGIMAKAMGSPYAAGRRGSDWLKVKPVHTLDLVVLAAEWGHGRRKGWLSNLHLGARNPDGSFTMLGKTFKGMTDAMLRAQTDALRKLAIGEEGHVVHVRPEFVVEVAFNDVQASPHYPGGMALRFARVKRHRPDKSAHEADTIEAVRAIHEAWTPSSQSD